MEDGLSLSDLVILVRSLLLRRCR